MPLYEYQCDACAMRFERIQKFSDAPIETCPACNGAVRKLVSSPAIQFKGSGWYITDYARKPKEGGTSGQDGGGPGKDSSKDSSKSASSEGASSSGSSGSTTPASTTTGATGSGGSSSSGSSSSGS